MKYTPLGLAGLVVTAIRTAVTDPALVERVGENADLIGDVRIRMTAMTNQLSELTTADASQQAVISGVVGELRELADALTGPDGDPSDNGVLAEVEVVEGAPVSAAADALLPVEEEVEEEPTKPAAEAQPTDGAETQPSDEPEAEAGPEPTEPADGGEVPENEGAVDPTPPTEGVDEGAPSA